MTALATETVWRERLDRIPNAVDAIHLPDAVGDDIDQDREWCEVVVEGEERRIRFHDYDEVFGIPGLYERLFYETLKCCSPSCVVRLLEDVARDFDEEPNDFRVLDVGAGNGMVGDELQSIGVDKIVGVDIIDEAKKATLRDRPEVYDDYVVADLTDLPEQKEEQLCEHRLNCLTTVAALGFGDIPPAAFLKALHLISTPGWVAFNIREDFLHERDNSGFSRLIRHLCREEYLQPQSYRRYQHRIAVSGEPLHYVAFIARKMKDLPGELLEEWK